MKYPKTKITKILEAIGFYILCKDEQGIRGFRQTIDSIKPKTNWAVVKRNLKLFEDEIFSNSVWEFLNDIKRELKEFKPFRIIH
jgi:hypothetical protein